MYKNDILKMKYMYALQQWKETIFFMGGGVGSREEQWPCIHKGNNLFISLGLHCLVSVCDVLFRNLFERQY